MSKLDVVSTVPPQKSSLVPLLLLSVFVAVLGLYAIFVSGPATRAVAQANLASALADENKAFCEKFGMQTGTAQFAACSAALTGIRKSQADRDGEAGML